MDIKTTWDSGALTGLWGVSAGALAADSDLETAVVLSLFTDRLAAADDHLPDGSTDRRGWWGDTGGGDVHGLPNVGSRLWLLSREKVSDETLNRARGYAEEALAWLVEDGVAGSVAVDAEWQPGGGLALDVTIIRLDGLTYSHRFDAAWEQIGN